MDNTERKIYGPSKARDSFENDIIVHVVNREKRNTFSNLTADVYSGRLDRLLVTLEEKRPFPANREGIPFHRDNVNRVRLKEHWKKLNVLIGNRYRTHYVQYTLDVAPANYHLFREIPSVAKFFNWSTVSR